MCVAINSNRKGYFTVGIYDAAGNNTKTAIVEAFWSLYADKVISKITVKDITEATGIHRTAFHVYYYNVFAVLDAVRKDQLDKLKYVCGTYTSSG